MADFSPNGRWLAYDSFETGINQVYVQPHPPAPGKWQVSSEEGGQPRWSADGRELFYRTETGLAVVAVSTERETFTHGRAEQLFDGAFLGGPAGVTVGGRAWADYDVTSDSQRFVMFPDTSGSRRSSRGTVTLVTKWFDELKRLVPTDP